MTRSTKERALFSATASPGSTGVETLSTKVPVVSGAKERGTA